MFYKKYKFCRVESKVVFCYNKENFLKKLTMTKRIKMIVEVHSVLVWAFRPEMEIVL